MPCSIKFSEARARKDKSGSPAGNAGNRSEVNTGTSRLSVSSRRRSSGSAQRSIPSVTRLATTCARKKESRVEHPHHTIFVTRRFHREDRRRTNKFRAARPFNPIALAIAMRTPAYEPGPRPTTIASSVQTNPPAALPIQRTIPNVFGHSRIEKCSDPLRDRTSDAAVRRRVFQGKNLHPLMTRRVSDSVSKQSSSRWGNQITKTIGPFDDRNSIAEKIIIQS